jgi:hypothetical protein
MPRNSPRISEIFGPPIPDNGAFASGPRALALELLALLKRQKIAALLVAKTQVGLDARAPRDRATLRAPERSPIIAEAVFADEFEKGAHEFASVVRASFGATRGLRGAGWRGGNGEERRGCRIGDRHGGS